MIRKLGELIHRLGFWIESLAPEETPEQALTRMGFELRGGEVYYEGEKVGTRYTEGEE